MKKEKFLPEKIENWKKFAEFLPFQPTFAKNFGRRQKSDNIKIIQNDGGSGHHSKTSNNNYVASYVRVKRDPCCHTCREHRSRGVT